MNEDCHGASVWLPPVTAADISSVATARNASRAKRRLHLIVPLAVDFCQAFDFDATVRA
jgi:hypothetical protein